MGETQKTSRDVIPSKIRYHAPYFPACCSTKGAGLRPMLVCAVLISGSAGVWSVHVTLSSQKGPLPAWSLLPSAIALLSA